MNIDIDKMLYTIMKIRQLCREANEAAADYYLMAVTVSETFHPVAPPFLQNTINIFSE